MNEGKKEVMAGLRESLRQLQKMEKILYPFRDRIWPTELIGRCHSVARSIDRALDYLERQP